MASRRRTRIEATDDWQQLQLQLDWPEQGRYELIRPVVVFGHSPVERAEQTGASARTIYRKVARFDELGMQSLLEADPVDDRRALPSVIRRTIAELQAEYPGFRATELATICHIRFNRRPSPHTIKKVLVEEPPPARSGRRFPPYAEMADPVQRRLAIVRLHAEGWSIRSIAAYLETNRPRVYKTLKRWLEEGIPGLEDKSHARTGPSHKVDLRVMEAIRKLQRNPELGAFRIHAALKQLGIHLSTRTCGRILARNRKLYGLRGPEATPREPKPMPFKAAYRHQYWTTDIRYLDHQLGGGNIYCISILENYSRLIVASVLSRTQDLGAYLRVLLVAVREYGAPGALVSDGGSIFRAKRAMAIYRALGVQKEQIARRQPWQSYIETCFNVQRRMADWDFAKAESWRELQELHAGWVHDYNTQEHWAHQERQDGRRCPREVLGWIKGRAFSEEELAGDFAPLLFTRRLDQQGYMRFRNWRLYGEHGLSGRQVVVWLTEEELTVQFAEEPLAQYGVKHHRDRRHFRQVTAMRLFETRYRSPQLPLLDGAAEPRRLAIELPERRRWWRSLRTMTQGVLFPPEDDDRLKPQVAGDRPADHSIT